MRLIDTDLLLKKKTILWDEALGFCDCVLVEDIDEAPGVEPVRCKDCKNRDEITKECKHPKAVGWDVIMPEDNDFCSYGERRTDG